MKKLIFAALLSILASGLVAETLVESFDDPLGGWRDRWLALNSNMQNYYVVMSGEDEDYRGNNPCGLWIHDGDTGSTDCTIVFDSAFGAGVTHFEMRIEVFVDLTLDVFDSAGNLVDSVYIPYNYSGGDYGCGGEVFAFDTPNGLGSFTMSGAYVEGNTAIDDVTVVTGVTATEETSWSAVKALY